MSATLRRCKCGCAGFEPRLLRARLSSPLLKSAGDSRLLTLGSHFHLFARSEVPTEEMPMNHRCRSLTVGLIAAAAFVIAPRLSAADATVVELGHLKSRTPSTWKEGPVTTQF